MIKPQIHLCWLELRRRRLFWFWLTTLWLAALILCFVPLFNLLAFEFSLAMALLGSLAGAHLGAGWEQDSRRQLLLEPLAAGALLLAAPWATISLNALRVKNCDYLEGLALYFLLAGLSMCCAVVAGVFIRAILQRKARSSAAAVGLVVLSWLWALLHFYFSPQIFAYGVFFGYFPGAIYDEDVAIRATFLLYRFYNLIWLAGLIMLAGHFYDPQKRRLSFSHRRWRGSFTVLTVLLLVTAASMWIWRSWLGFEQDAPSIARQLGGTRRTAHFVIHYSSSLTPGEVNRLAEDHEFRYAQLQEFFGAAPAQITSFIFASADEKRRLMGAHQTYVAKPWRREVYLQHADFPHPVLKHELAHVFAAQFGDRLFGLSWKGSRLNLGMVEGIATAADFRPAGELTLHQSAAALFRLGKAPPAQALFSSSFIFEAPSRSYTFSGSLCRFLYDRYGRDKLVELFKQGGDFSSIYQRPFEELFAEWRGFLQAQPLSEAALQAAKERFRRPGITSRVCAHEVANLLQQAEELVQQRRFPEAAEQLAQVCSYDAQNPQHLLAYWRSLAEAGQASEALRRSQSALSGPLFFGPLRAELEELRGDLLWENGQLAAAQELYKSAGLAATEAPNRRLLFLKHWALAQPAETRAALQAYLIGPPGKARDPAMDLYYASRLQQLIEDSGVGFYLVGKQLVSRDHCAEAVPMLSSALHLGLPQDDLVAEAWRLTGRCLYSEGKYELARDAFTALSQTAKASLGLAQEADDWLARIVWRSVLPPSKN